MPKNEEDEAVEIQDNKLALLKYYLNEPLASIPTATQIEIYNRMGCLELEETIHLVSTPRRGPGPFYRLWKEIADE